MTYPLSHRKKTRPIFWIAGSIALVLIMSATCSYVCMAAVISFQPPAETSLLRIPVILSGEGDETLAGLQFDLSYDPTQYTLEALEAGTAASDAAKEAILSEPVPGTGRVLITGFNDNELADGHVATLVLRPRIPGASAQGLAISQPLATDPFGNTIPLAYSDAYGYPPSPPEKTEAQLTEIPEAAGDELSSTPEFDTSGQTSPEDPRESPLDFEGGDSPLSGFGIGGATGNGTATQDIAKRRGTSAVVSPVRTSPPAAKGASRPARNQNFSQPTTSRPASGIANSTRSSSTGNVLTKSRSAGSAQRDYRYSGETHTDTEDPALPRLALLPSNTTGTAVKGAAPYSTFVGNDGALRTPRDSYRLLGATILFCVFFVGFSVIHVRTFRWLSGAKRRSTT